MIGQKELLKHMCSLIENNNFPRTSILIGDEGSGKKTLCNELCKQFKITPAYVGTKVDEIREMIKNAYVCVGKTLYIIPDADKMSGNASNALLKVLEEPPNNAYFILLYNDMFSVLKTIMSRSTVFMMHTYSCEELNEYIQCNHDKFTDDYKKLALEFCDTPGEVNIVLKNGDIKDFYIYTKKVVDHIATVQSANSFKIADKVALKEDDEGYNLKMFWKLFIFICLDIIKSETKGILKYAHGISITSKYLQDLRLRGVNKQTLMDMWILDIRKAWMK